MNFNRFINIMLYGKDGTFVIKTPNFGRKPNISLHGMLMSSEYARDFEVRVVNLYSEVDLTLFNKITVVAGYAGRSSLTLDGSISIIYTTEPGPDRITVIKCFIGDAETILNATMNKEFPAGTTLRTILEAMTDGMNKAIIPASTNTVRTRWESPQIDPSLEGLVCPAPLSWNGAVKDLLPRLKSLFPGVYIVSGNNKFIAYDPKLQVGKGRQVTIRNLMSPPTYTAGHAVVTAPWEPELKPGDTMYLPLSLRQIGQRDATATLAAQNPKRGWRVISVQFDFSTVEGQNKMIVTGA